MGSDLPKFLQREKALITGDDAAETRSPLQKANSVGWGRGVLNNFNGEWKPKSFAGTSSPHQNKQQNRFAIESINFCIREVPLEKWRSA
jgi:hypothetical protein